MGLQPARSIEQASPATRSRPATAATTIPIIAPVESELPEGGCGDDVGDAPCNGAGTGDGEGVPNGAGLGDGERPGDDDFLGDVPGDGDGDGDGVDGPLRGLAGVAVPTPVADANGAEVAAGEGPSAIPGAGAGLRAGAGLGGCAAAGFERASSVRTLMIIDILAQAWLCVARASFQCNNHILVPRLSKPDCIPQHPSHAASPAALRLVSLAATRCDKARNGSQ